MRKPRSDSKLASLPEHQRERLIAWLLDDGLSYAKAKEMLHEDFNVETSEAALGGFYQHFCRPLRLRRCAQAAQDLPELAGGLMMEDWDAPSMALVKQRYFELLAAPSANPKEVAVFAMQIADLARGKLEAEKLAFNQRKHAETTALKTETLALAREKFETDASEKALRFVSELKTIAANRSLTEPAKIDAVRRTMFGAAPATQEATP